MTFQCGSRCLVAFSVISLLLQHCGSVSAAVQPGDKPTLDFQAADGTPISLERLKGKIVVVDFWATWCGPCMAEAPHMVELNSKYAAQGMQFIGISLDSDKAQMVKVAAEKGFTWPQYFDGKGWENKYAQVWGVRGIPATFILSPEGQVLWTGHPATIDAPLEKAFKDHPPQLVDPKVLSAARSSLSIARKALVEGNAKGALAAMAKVPAEARLDKGFAADANAVGAELESTGEKLLAEVDPLIESKQYQPAVAKLRELSVALSGLKAGEQASKKLTELQSRPEVKSTLAKAAREDKAQALFDAAQSLKDQKKDEQAYPKFKTVTLEYSGTAAAEKAGAIVKSYEADRTFISHLNDATIAAKATSLLKVARSYAAAGRKDLARSKYQDVIDQFPHTSYADEATKGQAGLQD